MNGASDPTNLVVYFCIISLTFASALQCYWISFQFFSPGFTPFTYFLLISTASSLLYFFSYRIQSIFFPPPLHELQSYHGVGFEELE